MNAATIENPMIEIRNALKLMGYSGKFSILPFNYKRIEIFKINGERIGIYDLTRHTFVD